MTPLGNPEVPDENGRAQMSEGLVDMLRDNLKSTSEKYKVCEMFKLEYLLGTT